MYPYEIRTLCPSFSTLQSIEISVHVFLFDSSKLLCSFEGSVGRVQLGTCWFQVLLQSLIIRCSLAIALVYTIVHTEL